MEELKMNVFRIHYPGTVREIQGNSIRSPDTVKTL